ncbi:MAG TPA: hypothetical protein VF698_14190 [Thermoanaerobaculia bacterium]|jgi:hypothetical protein
MAIDPTYVWIAVGAIVILTVAALIARGARRTRSERLREHFGSEYDHALKTHGKRTAAERDLITRTEEARQIEIRPLTAAERDRYRGEWMRVEARFVERPTTAVVEADELIDEIMRAQGYPIGDFERHAAHLSVKHPRIVEHYRAGHDAIDSNKDGKSSTEELRQAMLHYRALFEELVGRGDDVARDIAVERELSDRDDVRRDAAIARDEVRPR